MQIGDFSSKPAFKLLIAPGYSFNIVAIKLELGSVSTLANDPPADYGEQLALCQCYMTTDKDQTMAAKLKAQNNTDYTTAQVRNIILSTSDADVGLMGEGDIWIKYE